MAFLGKQFRPKITIISPAELQGNVNATYSWLAHHIHKIGHIQTDSIHTKCHKRLTLQNGLNQQKQWPIQKVLDYLIIAIIDNVNTTVFYSYVYTHMQRHTLLVLKFVLDDVNTW